MIKKDSHLAGAIKSLGLVFGDIGTSPIYILSVLFLLTRPTPEHVIGVLSRGLNFKSRGRVVHPRDTKQELRINHESIAVEEPYLHDLRQD